MYMVRRMSRWIIPFAVAIIILVLYLLYQVLLIGWEI